MPDQIDTGYEAKFDFPLRKESPSVPYLLASVPRAGSTYFSHLLWKTGCLGAPLEYLNFLPLSPYGAAANSPSLQSQIWRSVLHRRCSPNGVFGLKAFPQQLDELQQRNPPLLAEVLDVVLPRDRPRRIVYLRRRDRVAHAVSYARANSSGVWRREQEREGAPALEYSQEAIEAAERGITIVEDIWDRMFSDLRMTPLSLSHEDVLDDPSGAARQVADYLGVEIDPAVEVKVPEIRKQSEGDSSAWIERYAGSRTPGHQSSNS